MGNVRGKHSSDLQRLRGAHFRVWDSDKLWFSVGVALGNLRMVLGFFVDMGLVLELRVL